MTPDARQFMLVGICGGCTTLSSFSFQTLALMRDGDFLEAGMNILLSVLLCMLSAWLGSVAAASFNQLKVTV